MILEGEVEVLREENGAAPQQLSQLKTGEFFGEMALLGKQARSATVRATTPVTVLALRQREFQSLVANIPDLRSKLEEVMERRQAVSPAVPLSSARRL
jgi:CRP-like cAMP-binding protein